MRKVNKLMKYSAERVALKNVKAACFFSLHQPKLPKGIEKLKK